jgi:hypothetical protein
MLLNFLKKKLNISINHNSTDKNAEITNIEHYHESLNLDSLTLSTLLSNSLSFHLSKELNIFTSIILFSSK